jgi:pimeloyl-ACP methyl ester carboxylesterase
VREETVVFGRHRSLVGILHRPEDDRPAADRPAVLLLNAGILHRVGPNRLYVKIARQLQERGFHVLRFDVWGIGDSQEYTGRLESGTFFDDTREAMDMLAERLGADRFLLMGICMGAKIALEVARRDTRVESLVLMEGIYIKSVRYHVSRILSPEKWRRLLTGDSYMIKAAKNKLMKRLHPSVARPAAVPQPSSSANPVLLLGEKTGQDMKGSLQALLKRGGKIILIFRDGNEIHHNYRLRRAGDEIYAIGLPAGMEVVFIPFADHTFTPLLSQNLLLQTTMDWVQENYPTPPVVVPAIVA